MRARNILIVIAIVFIFFNAISYIKGELNVPETNTVNKVAYLIGRNIFFLTGLILLVIAYFVHRKVERKKRKKMVEGLLK